MKLFRGSDNSDFTERRKLFWRRLRKCDLKKICKWKSWIVLQNFKVNVAQVVPTLVYN